MERISFNIKHLGVTFTSPMEKSKGTDLFSRIEGVPKDLTVKDVGGDKVFSSETRDLTLRVADIERQSKFNLEAAAHRISNIMNILNRADEEYREIAKDHTQDIPYITVLKKIVCDDMRREAEENAIRRKQEAKREAKKRFRNRKWFEIGKEYILKKNDIYGSETEEQRYRCVKFIYTVGTNPLNCVVMKKLSGKLGGEARALSPIDCQIFHIKHEANLYMFPMTQRFYPAPEQKEEDTTDVGFETLGPTDIPVFKISDCIRDQILSPAILIR